MWFDALNLNRRYFLRWGVFVLSVGWLTGCVHLTPPPSAVSAVKSVSSRQRALRRFTHWQISGAFSITQGRRRVLANYRWQQRGRDFYRLDIAGPLNVGALQILGRPGRVTLQRGAKRWQAADADRLLQSQLGWYFPVSSLYDWVRGLPTPAKSQAMHYDRFGRLSAFQQGHWQVRILRYQSALGMDLPGLIDLANMSIHPAIHIRWVAKQWQHLS